MPFLLFVCKPTFSQKVLKKGLLSSKINGVALMAPPSPFKKNPMPEIQAIGANWLGIQPFAFFYKNKPHIQYEDVYQWWGESREGIAKTVELARRADLKILLKPQLWAYNQWIGDLDFENPEDWAIFEAEYRYFILNMAMLADSLDIELFCVGTEAKRFAAECPEFWRILILEIRQVYKGKLIYAANWDNFNRINFWDLLDYVGVDAYFPLINKKKPTVKKLKRTWQATVDSMQQFYEQWQKPIIFTEFGYMSLEGTAYKAWLLELKKEEVRISEQAQANALQALLEVFGQKDWWAGGFQWKWYADIESVLSKDEVARDYTPQGKKAIDLLRLLYLE